MASNNEEPSSKRSRLEEKEIHPSIRYIKLDMSKYDISLQNYTDDDLVKIFELGLNVKESASLNVDVNRKMMEDALSSQMKPIRDSVKQIEEQVNKQVKKVQEDVNEKVGNEMTKFTEKVKKMEETLSSKMKPIDESVTRIEQQVNAQVLKVRQNVTQEVGSEMTKFAKNVESLKNDVSGHMTKIKDELTNRVDTVAQKVQPLDTLNSSITTSAGDIKTKIHEEIEGSEQRVSGQLKECEKKLDKISSSLEKPSNKGARAERKVIDVLKQNLTNFTFVPTHSEMGKGDIKVHSPNNNNFMIEVKEWSGPLSKDAIQKFERNLAKSPHFKVGILLSMTSGIARRSREGRFEIAFDQSQRQFQIYVPNAYANNDEHLIVWSVVMADQLAQIDGELGEMKTKGLNKIYQKFEANVEHSKKCKLSLEALESSMQNLKENIRPILDTVNETENDIYKLLH